MTTVVDVFNQGGIIAYPTEAVFGLGCDPDNEHAINLLLQLKNRPIDKGLILLASHFDQLVPYINTSDISDTTMNDILARWPNGTTQLLPKSKRVSSWLSGAFDTIAVRVTNQPDVVELCNATGKPIVSTSANLSGEPPVKAWQDMPLELTNRINFIVKGCTLGYQQPSRIINAITGETIRS